MNIVSTVLLLCPIAFWECLIYTFKHLIQANYTNHVEHVIMTFYTPSLFIIRVDQYYSVSDHVNSYKKHNNTYTGFFTTQTTPKRKIMKINGKVTDAMASVAAKNHIKHDSLTEAIV